MLPVSEKHEFMYGDKEKKASTGESDLTFKPMLNKKSIDMINRKARNALTGQSESEMQDYMAPYKESYRNHHTTSK